MPDPNGYAALWDVDGTLVDTAEQHFRAWAAAARERGRPFNRDDFARTFGRRNPEQIEVLSGLAEGERIISSGYERLRRFDRIEIQPEKNSTGESQ